MAMDCDSVRFPPFVGAKGALYDSCVALNQQEGLDAHGKPLPAGSTPAPGNTGGSFFGVPLPSSAWERHLMFRIVEVVIGVAIVIVGVKAFTASSPTTKLIVQTGKKIDKGSRG